MKAHRGIGLAFVAAGIVLITASLGLLIYNQLDSERARKAAESELEALEKAMEERSQEEQGENQPGSAGFLPLEEIWINGNGYIGFISIPELDLDLPVMSDWDYQKLKVAPCRYYGDPRTHNMVIAAHNYSYFFGNLKHLSQGDQVVFTDINRNQYFYQVEELDILQPTWVDEMIGSGYDLTLFTCTLEGLSRVTVRCSELK